MTTYTIHVRCPACGELHLVSRESYTDQPPVENLFWCEKVQDYIQQPDPEQWIVKRRSYELPPSSDHRVVDS